MLLEWSEPTIILDPLASETFQQTQHRFAFKPDFNHDDTLLNEKALYLNSNDTSTLSLCSKCEQYLKNNKIPPLSISNGFYFKYPTHLPGLNYIESHIISRLQVQTGIIKLSQFSRTNSQFGFRGHFLAKPQNPDQLLNILPINSSELVDALHVIFVTEKKGEPPTLTTFKSLFKVSIFDWFQLQSEPKQITHRRSFSSLK